MKILIISYFFPPFNRIGSLRTGKMAKYLHQFGHDIRVVTHDHHSKNKSAPLEIPKEHCILTNAKTFEQTIQSDYYKKSRLGKILVRFLKSVTHKKPSYMLPGSSWAWYGEGVDKANELIESWKPDLIYSSALPISSHFIARKISVTHGIPWVAEYRDLWSGGHGARVSKIQSTYLKQIEKWLLRPADGIITVSEPLAKYLRLLHDKIVSVIYNGYDINPYTYERKENEVQTSGQYDTLSIVYTGSIYEGRDPRILFEALNRMGEYKNRVRVSFYTSKNPELDHQIENYDLKKCVKRFDFVPYNESLRVQSEADILLYLSYSSKTHAGDGILSGKVFEYLGAGRPILSIGEDSGHLFIEQGLMIHSDTPEKIKEQLVKWIREKQTIGEIKAGQNQKLKNLYSRKEQTKRAEEYIFSLLNENN